MKILVINASADVLVVGAVEDNKTLFELSDGERSSHSVAINAAVGKVTQNMTGLKDFDAYAVCVGPGSFTGIRVGIAAVKGYRMVFDKPVICFNSLQLAAYNVKGDCEVVMQAGRGRYYRCSFRDGKQTGLPSLAEKFPESGKRVVEYDPRDPYAEETACVVREAYFNKDFSEDISPMYLQLCQAEEDRAKKSSFELRPITPLHVADVAAAEKEIFTNEAWNESMIEYSVKAEPVSFFGAFDGSVLMGYACLEIAFETAYLSNIAVKPVFRRKGVGELLLRRCAVVAADRGASRIVLDVRKSNFAAIALYKKAGYTEVCLRKNFYGNEDAVTMAVSLPEKNL